MYFRIFEQMQLVIMFQVCGLKSIWLISFFPPPSPTPTWIHAQDTELVHCIWIYNSRHCDCSKAGSLTTWVVVSAHYVLYKSPWKFLEIEVYSVDAVIWEKVLKSLCPQNSSKCLKCLAQWMFNEYLFRFFWLQLIPSITVDQVPHIVKVSAKFLQHKQG